MLMLQINTTPWINTNLGIRAFQSLKYCSIILVLVAATLLSPVIAWGQVATNTNSTFGTNTSTVTITVNGKLDVSGGKIFQFSSQSMASEKLIEESYSSPPSNNYVDLSDPSISQANLSKNWHFIAILIDSHLHGNSGADAHISSITIPTTEIRLNEDYEIGKHASRYFLVSWTDSSNPMKIMFDHIKPKKIWIYGLLKKS
jgi:hypothetical protein